MEALVCSPPLSLMLHFPSVIFVTVEWTVEYQLHFFSCFDFQIYSLSRSVTHISVSVNFSNNIYPAYYMSYYSW
jgi:hypothetical protein